MRPIRSSAIFVFLLAPSSFPAGAAEPAIQPILIFMQPEDALEQVGKLEFQANPLEVYGNITAAGLDAAVSKPSPGARARQANNGIPFRSLLAIPQPDGSYLVYGCDSTPTSEKPTTFDWRLYRARTLDGHQFTDLQEVYRNPKGPWLIEAAMVRQESTGRLFFYRWSRSKEPQHGHALWGFVSDDGDDWSPLSDKPLYHDHDAFGIMWDTRNNRFLTGQVTYQDWPKPYADNMGSSIRRVLHMRTSRDGVQWETSGNAATNGLITPDEQDSPDLEFYRMQPMFYGDRYLALTDLYAASPLLPNAHGPHLACEWWVSADGLDWQRPWRSVEAQGDTPYPFKMDPMWFGRRMLFWTGGQVCGLPEYRIASIGARSNAEFSSVAFTMPDKPLLLNASVPGGRGLFDQAYVQVELRDETGQVIPGYERDKCLLQRIDDTRIPLRWGDKAGAELAGNRVCLRFYLRGARLYILGIES